MNDLEKLMKIATIIANLNIVEGYSFDEEDLKNLWEAVSLSREIVEV